MNTNPNEILTFINNNRTELISGTSIFLLLIYGIIQGTSQDGVGLLGFRYFLSTHVILLGLIILTALYLIKFENEKYGKTSAIVLSLSFVIVIFYIISLLI